MVLGKTKSIEICLFVSFPACGVYLLALLRAV